MKPSNKSPQLANLFEVMAGRTTAITNNVCINPPIGCGGPAEKFRDELSEREYRISGLCQKCQDSIFGV